MGNSFSVHKLQDETTRNIIIEEQTDSVVGYFESFFIMLGWYKPSQLLLENKPSPTSTPKQSLEPSDNVIISNDSVETDSTTTGETTGAETKKDDIKVVKFNLEKTKPMDIPKKKKRIHSNNK